MELQSMSERRGVRKKKKKRRGLSKEERKQRDRERLKEQQKRRKEREKKFQELLEIQQRNEAQTQHWQKQQERKQLLVLEKQDIDACRPQLISPIFAGYDRIRPRICHHPIFQSKTIQYLNSRNSDDAPLPSWPHPACKGYAYIQNESSRISPIFFDAHFFKIECSPDDLDESEDDQEDEEQALRKRRIDSSVIDRNTIAGVTMDEKKQNMFNAIQQLINIDECPVCASNDAPGCPGCWNPMMPDAADGDPILLANLTGQRASYNILSARQGRVDRRRSLLRSAESQVFELDCADEDDAYDSGEEEAYIESFLKDTNDIEKYRAQTKNYIEIVIKAVPAGNAVQLKLDTKDTIEYLYELYRANFDDPNRKLHILLPTMQGVFYFDPSVVPETDFRNAVTMGQLMLQDYKLAPSGQKIMMISVSVLHPVNTPRMLEYFIRNNFRISGVQLQMRYTPNAVPTDLLDDPIQIEMEKGAENLIRSAAANRQMTLELEKNQTAQRLKQMYEDEMQAFLAEKAKHKVAAKSKREIRALMYFKYADELHLDPFERLHRLWNCFQKFEELKLMKQTKLVEATASDTVRDLIATHTKVTVEAFRVAIGYEETRLRFGIKHLGNGKLVLYIGDRLGLVAKEDRQYGIELDLESYDTIVTGGSQDEGDVAPMPNGGGLMTFKDVEWEDKKVTETMFGFTDLVIIPFYKYRWDRVARAYRDAETAVTQAKQIVEKFNLLVKLYRSESVLDKKAIKKWIHDLESLQAMVGTTGVMAQSCRRLRGRYGSIRSRTKHTGGGSAAATAEEIQEELGRSRIATMLMSKDPSSRLDMTRRQSNIRSLLVEDFRKRRESELIKQPMSRRRETIRQSIKGIKQLVKRP